jgi:hypothetical protein
MFHPGPHDVRWTQLLAGLLRVVAVERPVVVAALAVLAVLDLFAVLADLPPEVDAAASLPEPFPEVAEPFPAFAEPMGAVALLPDALVTFDCLPAVFLAVDLAAFVDLAEDVERSSTISFRSRAASARDSSS